MSAGQLLREWRLRRGMSQLDLALSADVSARHVSLVETGRSRPSANMVLRLATQLDVPLRSRNELLLAAGYAPHYPERSIDEAELGAARHAIHTVLRAHEPLPAVVIDRRWDIVQMNGAVEPFLAGVDRALLDPPVNWARLGMHERGMAPMIVNLDQVRAVLRTRLARQIARTGAPELVALYGELFTDGPADDEPSVPLETEIVIPMIIRHEGRELRLFSTVTTFGTPQDITLEEIAIESYYPADPATAEFFAR